MLLDHQWRSENKGAQEATAATTAEAGGWGGVTDIWGWVRTTVGLPWLPGLHYINTALVMGYRVHLEGLSRRSDKQGWEGKARSEWRGQACIFPGSLITQRGLAQALLGSYRQRGLAQALLGPYRQRGHSPGSAGFI